MKEYVEVRNKGEKAVLVGLANKNQPPEKLKEYLDELEFLARTSGAKTLTTFTQRLEKPDTKFFVGKGKLEEIREYIQENAVDLVIFDDDLSPSQVRNLEKYLKNVKILDRSLLILNIFSIRAKTARAKTQVELAQYQYLYPRLTNLWTHLSKQKGGIGTKGPGEKELETDRRIVNDKIAQYRKKLEKIDKQSNVQRKNRTGITRVALVGYTNAGKSTLMKRLSKEEVFAENKLFATLDSTVRKVVIDNIPFLLTDTVGFIRKLPPTLIECFKSTLDEIREADLLMHVVDVSHPSFEEQIDIVNNTLTEIGAGEKPTLLVFNKIDQFAGKTEEEEGDEEEPEHNGEEVNGTGTEEAKGISIEKLKRSYINDLGPNTIFISATEKNNIVELREKIRDMAAEIHYSMYPHYLYKDE